jgi:hypothetical protein
MLALVAFSGAASLRWEARVSPPLFAVVTFKGTYIVPSAKRTPANILMDALIVFPGREVIPETAFF